MLTNNFSRHIRNCLLIDWATIGFVSCICRVVLRKNRVGGHRHCSTSAVDWMLDLISACCAASCSWLGMCASVSLGLRRMLSCKYSLEISSQILTTLVDCRIHPLGIFIVGVLVVIGVFIHDNRWLMRRVLSLFKLIQPFIQLNISQLLFNSSVGVLGQAIMHVTVNLEPRCSGGRWASLGVATWPKPFEDVVLPHRGSITMRGFSNSSSWAVTRYRFIGLQGRWRSSRVRVVVVVLWKVSVRGLVWSLATCDVIVQPT